MNNDFSQKARSFTLLNSFTNRATLSLSGTKGIRDSQIEYMGELPNFKTLDITNNRITNRGADLKQNCRIARI